MLMKSDISLYEELFNDIELFIHLELHIAIKLVINITYKQIGALY